MGCSSGPEPARQTEWGQTEWGQVFKENGMGTGLQGTGMGPEWGQVFKNKGNAGMDRDRNGDT